MALAGDVVRLEDYDARRLDALIPMWRAAFEAGVGIVDPHSLDEQRQYFIDEVLAHNVVKLAVLDDRLVGFVAATKDSVTQLMVDVRHHRLGIGTLMLDWAKGQSNGHLWLFTFVKNRIACTFYERHGFTIVARGFEPTWQLDDVRYAWSLHP